MAGPGLPGNGVDAFDVSILHALAALVNGGQEAEVLLQAGLGSGFVLLRLFRILAGHQGTAKLFRPGSRPKPHPKQSKL